MYQCCHHFTREKILKKEISRKKSLRLLELIRTNIDIIFLAEIFFISPVLSMPFSIGFFLFFNRKKKQTIYAVFFALAMAFLAFHTVPANTDDLCRHYEVMEALRYVELKESFSFGYSNVYLNTLIMYIVAKINVFGLYPAIYIFIGYVLIFYNMIRLNIKKRSVLEITVIVMFVFFCVNCRDFISGLRNYFAFIVCAYLIISQKYFKKNIYFCYMGIALMGFIHNACFIILIILIFSDLVSKTRNKWFRRGIYCIMCLALPISVIGMKIIFIFFPGLSTSAFFNKVYNYLVTPNIFNVNVYIYQLGILVLAVLCHCMNKKRQKKVFEKINSFIDCYLIVLIAISPIMLLLTRFLYLLIPMMPIIFIQTFSTIKEKRILKNCLCGIIGIFALAGVCVLLASMKAYPWEFNLNNVFFWFL